MERISNPWDGDVEFEIALNEYYETYNLIRDIDYADFLKVIMHFLDDKYQPKTKYLKNGLFRLRDKEIMVCSPSALKWLILGIWDGHEEFI